MWLWGAALMADVLLEAGIYVIGYVRVALNQSLLGYMNGVVVSFLIACCLEMRKGGDIRPWRLDDT